MPHRFPKATRWTAGLVFTLLCAAVAAYAFTVLYGQPRADNPLQMKFAASGLDVPAHLFGGGLALLLAPLQMNGWIQRRAPRLHRLSGGLYTGGVLIAGLAGFSLALHAEGGAPTGIAFGLLAVAWLATTGIGIGHALAGNLARHRQWMWRSIALTASAVSFRLILGIGLGVLHLPFAPVYLAAAWGCWLFNLAVCELVLRWPRRSSATALSAVR
ncbi:DUF2306 domain-containing protein [Stenotrophomonas maltophilia]|uniref:DUF2306 domain-containing protein n=1 Tax=Stenotrophomonas maltophilia TaxID=40324 RepID=A0A2W6IY39_STEMA|nr:DUF2306 domain-containing protein [Stenotrophomonas maltophilia]PZS88795.1 hypothetical protein A7X83_14145 [Stenotrophomonas maltophilia]